MKHRQSLGLPRHIGALAYARPIAPFKVHRRDRRAKTDRLDGHKLLTMLLRHAAGEKKVWSVVRVPSVAAEDRRQWHRDLVTTKRDRPRVINRLTGLLAGGGMRLEVQGDVGTQCEEVRQWEGTPRPAAWRAPEAGVAEGPASHGADREPGGRAARGVAHQCRAGAGAGPPVSHAARAWDQECVALCDGSLCVAGRADA
jgi:hypothetical protein